MVVVEAAILEARRELEGLRHQVLGRRLEPGCEVGNAQFSSLQGAFPTARE